MATRNIREMMLVLDARLGSGMRAATTETQKRLQGVNERIRELEKQRIDVTKFRRLKEAVGSTDKAFEAATAEAGRLARQIQAAERPSKGLGRAFEQTKGKARKLKSELRSKRVELEHLRRSLHRAGVATGDLATDSRRLDSQFGAARKEADALTARLKRLQAQEQKAGSAMQNIGARVRGGLAAIGRGAVGFAAEYIALSMLADGYRDVVSAAQESQNAERRLQKLMRNVPGATRASIEGIKRYASELQRVTTIEDDVTVHGASQLATFQLQGKNIRKLIPALQDLAVGQYDIDVTTQEMQQSANLMGKVFTGQVGALSRVGITMTKAQQQILKTGNESERTAMLVEVLAKNYGGLARAMAQTEEGQILQVRNAIDEIKETIGNELLPIQRKVVAYLAANLPQIQSGLLAVVGAALAVGRAIYAMGAAGVRAFGWYQKHLSWMTPMILGAAGALGTLRLAVMAVAMASRVWAAAQMLVNGTIAISPIGWIVMGIGVLVGAVYLLVKNWDKVKAAAVRAWDWMKRIAGSVAQFKPIAFYIGVMKAQWQAVVGVVRTLWDWLKRIWGIVGKVAGAIGRAASWTGKKVGIGGHAAGGIVTQPQLSWIGEQGREAIIPLSSHRTRAERLWAMAGQELGLAGAGIGSVAFNPTINISGSADRGTLDRALGQARDDFRRMLEQVLRDDRRRSMA